MVPVNYVGVLLAAIAAFILGFLAHGPVAGKLWMKLASITPTGNEKLSDMVPQMVSNLLVNIVCAYVLAVVYVFMTTSTYGSAPGIWSGVMTGVWVWLGFNITATIIGVIWMKQSKKLWLFEAISSLVVFAAMGAIIAVW